MNLKKYKIGSKVFEVLAPPKNWNFNKKEIPLILTHYSLDQRLKLLNSYMNMCGDREEMILDNFILDFSHIFSLRKNYQDDPMYGLSLINNKYIKSNNALAGLSQKYGMSGFMLYVYLQLIHSYSGENDQLVWLGLTNGIPYLRDNILNNNNLKVLRSDLFQQFFTKGTKVREWLANEIFEILMPKYVKLLKKGDNSIGKKTSWEIMHLSETVYSWMKTNTSQPRLKYATKDAVLDFSIVYPELVNPESFLEAGPGCKLGLYQLFGIYPKTHKNQLKCYNIIKESESYPLRINHYSRIEAQVCYFYKHLLMKNGWIKLRNIK